MLDSIRAFFTRNIAIGNGNNTGEPAAQGDAGSGDTHRLHVAACALLLELAHADDEFTDAERQHITAVLQRHFSLDAETASTLMRLAEDERGAAIDLYQFTSLIRSSYDLGQKTLLAEIMWGLILTDGEIARHESYMLRKIANLLDLEPGYLAHARKRAAEKLD